MHGKVTTHDGKKDSNFSYSRKQAMFSVLFIYDLLGDKCLPWNHSITLHTFGSTPSPGILSNDFTNRNFPGPSYFLETRQIHFKSFKIAQLFPMYFSRVFDVFRSSVGRMAVTGHQWCHSFRHCTAHSWPQTRLSKDMHMSLYVVWSPENIFMNYFHELVVAAVHDGSGWNCCRYCRYCSNSCFFEFPWPFLRHHLVLWT